MEEGRKEGGLFPEFEGGEAVREGAGAVEELGDGFGEVGRGRHGEGEEGVEDDRYELTFKKK